MANTGVWCLIVANIIFQNLGYCRKTVTLHCGDQVRASELTLDVHFLPVRNFSDICEITIVTNNDHTFLIYYKGPLTYVQLCSWIEIYANEAPQENICEGTQRSGMKTWFVSSSRLRMVFNTRAVRDQTIIETIRLQPFSLKLAKFVTAKPVAHDCDTGMFTNSKSAELCCYHGMYRGMKNVTNMRICDKNRCLHESLECDDFRHCIDKSDEGFRCYPWWIWALTGACCVFVMSVLVFTSVTVVRIVRHRTTDQTMTQDNYRATFDAAVDFI